MAYYYKKPIPIEAIQYTGDNREEMMEFTKHSIMFKDENGVKILIIHTLEGDMRAEIGSYIIKGVDGEFYPCREDIFEKTYNKVGE